MQRYTVYFIRKLFYIIRVDPPLLPTTATCRYSGR